MRSRSGHLRAVDPLEGQEVPELVGAYALEAGKAYRAIVDESGWDVADAWFQREAAKIERGETPEWVKTVDEQRRLK